MLRNFLKIVVFLSYFQDRPILIKKKNPPKPCGSRGFLVETAGLEPVTSCV